MDPSFVTTEVWHDISVMLRFLWIYLLLIIGFATLFLTAHAVIPSLASSRQVSSKITKLRPILYLMAFGTLLLAILMFVLTFVNAGWIPDVLDRWWI